MDKIGHYEARAAMFHAATGVMAPGKDVPSAIGGYDEHVLRHKLYEIWCRVIALEAAIRQHREDSIEYLAARNELLEEVGEASIDVEPRDKRLWAAIGEK